MTDGGRGLDLGTVLRMSEWTLMNPEEVMIIERTSHAGRDEHLGGRLASRGRRARAVTIERWSRALTRVLVRRSAPSRPVGM